MKYFCLDCHKEKSRKGLYCKSCGYSHRPRKSGLKYTIKAINTSWFKKGESHPRAKGLIPWNKNIKGIHLSPSTEFKKGSKPWCAGKKRPEITGINHPLWKADGVGYSAIHSWVKRKLGNPSKCDKCGTNESKRFDWDNISGEYKRDLSDWQRLCTMCHYHKHKNWEAIWHVL